MLPPKIIEQRHNGMELLNLSLTELEEAAKALGEPKYRARQLFDWLYKGVTDFDDMKNIPARLREKFKENFEISSPVITKEQVSKEDGTRKFLLEYSDGIAIETVFMKYKYGNTLCVSSQAGCRMGCKFCASTVNGLSRNLTSGEMVAEILTVENRMREDLNNGSRSEKDWRIGHVVGMGTGEPFDNYENVSKFINLIHDPNGLNISMRNITVSTCGLVPLIDRFGDDFPQVNLAISLHGTTDEIRSSMMPINNRYPIKELIEAAKTYTEKTNRRITFEYTMVNGVNDSDEDAIRLIKLLRGMLCHVNIIPLNNVEGSGFDTVSRKRAGEFAEILEKAGLPVTVRRELGRDIDAACGQLRLKS